MSMTNLNIRLDADLKTRVEAILNEMGMNFTTAVNVYFRQILRTGEIPFKIKADTPNEETLEAIREVEQMQKNPSGYRTYSSFNEILSEALKEIESDV